MRQRNEREKLAPRIGHEHLRIAEITAATCATERHYTVRELAATWKLSPSTETRIFRDEPGRVEDRYGECPSRSPRARDAPNSGVRCSTGLSKAGGAVNVRPWLPKPDSTHLPSSPAAALMAATYVSVSSRRSRHSAQISRCSSSGSNSASRRVRMAYRSRSSSEA